MKVLVTGGTGVIGRATVSALLRRGHQIRLLSRGAAEAPAEWSEPVEPFPADIGDPARVHGAADGCTAVIHITGIVDEAPPELTFDRINVAGTENIVREAARAGVQRLIFVSSLGAERGDTDYHRSKLRGEEITKRFSGAWTIMRVGAVMGPGDETVSVLLRMTRMLPVIPIIGDGEQRFQPVWHQDVGRALADCLERDDIAGETLHVAGPDVVTVRAVLDLFGEITARTPLRVPLPSFAAKFGSTLASALGIDTPVSAATVQMLLEGNYLRDDESNDLIRRLGIRPRPAREHLIELVDASPEQTPDQGVGKLQRRRFSIQIRDCGSTATELMHRFRTRFSEIVPFDAAAEPGAPTLPELDATMTFEMPARGHVQVRVEQLDDHTITLVTVEGHPLAGVVRFHFQDEGDNAVRFTIDVIDRPASRIDQLSMALVGRAAQARTWKQTAENVAGDSGGTTADGVTEESWDLDGAEAERLEDWIRRIVQRRRRETVKRT